MAADLFTEACIETSPGAPRSCASCRFSKLWPGFAAPWCERPLGWFRRSTFIPGFLFCGVERSKGWIGCRVCGREGRFWQAHDRAAAGGCQ